MTSPEVRSSNSEERVKSVACLGVGRMASALIDRFVETATCLPAQIVGTHHDTRRASELSERLGVQVVTSNSEAVARCSTVLLCVRPQQMKTLITEIHGALNPEHTLISIAVGVPLTWLRASLDVCGPILHVHPPSLVMAHSLGTSYIAHEVMVPQGALTAVQGLFRALGPTAVVPEAMMELYAVFSGCAPALIGRIVSRWRVLAEHSGIPAVQSEQIVGAILGGLAHGLTIEKLTLERIEERIATPQGVTQAGLDILMSQGIDDILSSVAGHCLQKMQHIRSLFE